MKLLLVSFLLYISALSFYGYSNDCLTMGNRNPPQSCPDGLRSQDIFACPPGEVVIGIRSLDVGIQCAFGLGYILGDIDLICATVSNGLWHTVNKKALDHIRYWRTVMCPVNTAAFEVRGKRGSLFDSLFFKCKELGDDGFVAENGTETEIDRVGGSTGGNNLNPVACPNNTVFNKIDSHVFGTPLDASIRKGTLEIKLCCDKYGQQMYFDNNKCMSSFPIILNGSGLLLEDSSKHISLLGDQYSNYSLCAPVYTTFNNGLDGVIWLTDSEDNKPFIYSEHNEQCPSGASSWMISNYIPRVGNPINVQFEYDESNNKCPSRFYILTTNITINNTDDFVNQFLELSGNYSSFGSWVSDSKTIYDNGLYIAIENRGAPFKLRTLKVMSNNNTYDFTEISSTATEMTSTATKMTSTATEMTSTTTKMTSTTTKMTSTTTEMSCSGHIVAAFLSFAITMCLLTYL